MYLLVGGIWLPFRLVRACTCTYVLVTGKIFNSLRTGLGYGDVNDV